jgi:hypothetical protein
MERDLMLRGELLAKALREELGPRPHLWRDRNLSVVAGLIAAAYRPGVTRWLVQERRDPAAAAGCTYAVQRGSEETATIFEDPEVQRADLVREVLNRLEDAAEGSSDQADGAG